MDNEIHSIEQLKEYCCSCETLYDVLTKYTDSYTVNDIIEDLKCNDTLYDMADSNGMDDDSMAEWLTRHIGDSAECRVFLEKGPAGGWPVVSVKCSDMVFYIDWVLL